ncbi:MULTISPECIES: hypothetical protein [Haloprofundus]|uniref:hypothetical protein n=1 Tax=Haloprofundus TaxID=1911573 RepID=UPI000E45267A|nr:MULTISPECIES: hypothetical protein [Haloprofundus]QCJ47823.1 hypothetical protein FCF25_12145 [Haloprofundus sp. MHR1]
MTPSTHGRLVAGAVRIGSLGLFGLPTYLVTVRAAEILASLAVGSLSGEWEVVASVAAVALSYVVVTEVAAVRLDGFAALSRSGRLPNLVRHVTLSVAVFAAVVVTVEFLASGFVWAVSRDHTVLFGLGTVVAAAVTWALGRALSAFYRGYRGDDGV